LAVIFGAGRAIGANLQMAEVVAADLLADCLARARVHQQLLVDAEKHRIFALSAFPVGLDALARSQLRTPGFVAASLARWHAACDEGACLRARLQLLARFAEVVRFECPPAWGVAERIASSRARVHPPAVATGCVLYSLLFGGGDAPLRWITRKRPPYKSVFVAYAAEVERLRRNGGLDHWPK
jgi:hypothetical protein